ncbi:hypothetical protein FOMA001_g1437 [Fusarium oxysporum f. sp. matthiolae]|nr:hypothetical protein FOMA001_g1437 [Fusarium oxysporum f. sp. matthiolae]
MTQTKFSSLRSKLVQGRLLLPGDEGFEESLQRWSLTCIKPAAAVAQPRTAEEASEVVKFATSNGIKFNVKGGGHSTSQTSCAPSPEGMVLDLSLMRDVSVDTEANTVSFGGGCLWKDVDEALWPKGLATVGGTVSHTGVGGLILHGGYGVLSGIHGLAIDVLLSCQVVLADGSIVTASSTENSDLFWALRGAGSSFGVVTQFTSKIFPQGDIWGGMAFLPPSALPAVIKPLVVLVQMAQMGPNPEEDGQKYFAPILELEALMKQVGPMPYPMINQGADEVFAKGSRYLFGGANFTLPMELSTAESIRDKFTGFVEDTPGTEGSVVMIECIPQKTIRTIPVESTSFNSRGNYYNVGINYKWMDESLDAKIRQFNRGFQKSIRELGYDDKALSDGIGHYLNYVSTDTISAEEAFGSNSKRLRGLKKRYDPNNVFDKLWKLVGEVEDNNWIA